MESKSRAMALLRQRCTSLKVITIGCIRATGVIDSTWQLMLGCSQNTTPYGALQSAYSKCCNVRIWHTAKKCLVFCVGEVPCKNPNLLNE